MDILARLMELKDDKNALFQAKLTPGPDAASFLGVRVPNARKLAKEVYKENNFYDFLNTTPHKYFDENMLHVLILSQMKNYDECVSYIDAFLPYVDNWAVCDILSPTVFKKNKARLLTKVKEWSASSAPYTCRFGIEMLMSHFLDDDFKTEYLEIPASVKSEEYYVNMMLAWFFATALAKQWDATVSYLTENRLGTWVHNKTIQKARESYRITEEQKEYLKTLKRTESKK